MKKEVKKRMTKRRFLKLVAGGAVAVGGSTAYAFGVEPDLLVVREVELKIRHLPAGFDGLKVAQLTDIHFDRDQDEELLAKMVERVNELQADVILYTGDFITRDMLSFELLLEYLAKVKVVHGAYGIMGNHDTWYSSFARMKPMFQRVGVDFLSNQSSQLHHQGESLWLNGLDSAWGGKPLIEKSFVGIPKESACLTMMHEPDVFDEIAQRRVSFTQFSGHTHGGQCRVPLIGYAPVKVRYGEKYIEGHFEKNLDQQLYVSAGIGTVGLRVRFSCPPEIVLFTLKTNN